jgi:hypothetical protein
VTACDFSKIVAWESLEIKVEPTIIYIIQIIGLYLGPVFGILGLLVYRTLIYEIFY